MHALVPRTRGTDYDVTLSVARRALLGAGLLFEAAPRALGGVGHADASMNVGHDRIPDVMRPAIAVVLLVVWCSLAAANGPEVGWNAGAIVPVQSDHVQLLSEQVWVYLPDVGGRGHTACNYYLKNLTSGPVVIEMSFLTSVPNGGPDEIASAFDGSRFMVEVESEGTAFRMAPVSRDLWTEFVREVPESLPVWTMAFEPYETLSVFMKQEIVWSGGGEGDSSWLDFTYHARPARLWAGEVERAHICFLLPGVLGSMIRCIPEETDCYSYRASPPGFVFTSAGFYWDFENWEPSEDLSFGMSFSH